MDVRHGLQVRVEIEEEKGGGTEEGGQSYHTESN